MGDPHEAWCGGLGLHANYGGSMIEETTLNHAWGAVRVVLPEAFTFYEIKDVAGLAGLDMTRLSGLVQRAGGGASKGQLMTALDQEVGRLSDHSKFRVLNSLAEEICTTRPAHREDLAKRLRRLGWQFVDGNLIPIELFDVAELAELPVAARTDLVKAATRLRDGDLTGALASACAAVDSATNDVYAEKGLGSPQNHDSFQTRCAKALAAQNTISKLESELTASGWEQPDVDRLVGNLKGALNQAAYVMQTLRPRMGDVHGSKAVVNAMVFDSLKWAALLVRMLK